MRSKNTKEGIRRALKDGYYPYGMPPIGYSKDHGGTKTPLLVPNEKAELVVEAFELFSTGLYQLEELRKKLWKKGLKLGDYSVWPDVEKSHLHGKIVVSEYKDEEACLVNGLHQALVSENLFLKVQRILESRRTKNSHVVGKSKLREELPLRGHLKCYKCGRIWTGSVSKGNGVNMLTTTVTTNVEKGQVQKRHTKNLALICRPSSLSLKCQSFILL